MEKIKGFKYYYINKYGDVFSNKSGRFIKLKPYICRNGYISIRLQSEDGKRPHKLIHRLVAETYIPNENNLSEVNYISCDLYVDSIFVKRFTTIREACEYASKVYNTSFLYLYKYKKVKNIKICEVSEECNDYPVAGSTVDDELPLEVHCILF